MIAFVFAVTPDLEPDLDFDFDFVPGLFLPAGFFFEDFLLAMVKQTNRRLACQNKSLRRPQALLPERHLRASSDLRRCVWSERAVALECVQRAFRIYPAWVLSLVKARHATALPPANHVSRAGYFTSSESILKYDQRHRCSRQDCHPEWSLQG